jgi:SAM-dependent methyltransferase
MGKFYSKNYWSVGFQSRLYDRLSPESYLESMRRVVAFLPEGKSLTLLDAGCGSGLLLRFLEARIREGLVYTGTDLLKSGVARRCYALKNWGLPTGFPVSSPI